MSQWGNGGDAESRSDQNPSLAGHRLDPHVYAPLGLTTRPPQGKVPELLHLNFCAVPAPAVCVCLC